MTEAQDAVAVLLDRIDYVNGADARDVVQRVKDAIAALAATPAASGEADAASWAVALDDCQREVDRLRAEAAGTLDVEQLAGWLCQARHSYHPDIDVSGPCHLCHDLSQKAARLAKAER